MKNALNFGEIVWQIVILSANKDFFFFSKFQNKWNKIGLERDGSLSKSSLDLAEDMSLISNNTHLAANNLLHFQKVLFVPQVKPGMKVIRR